MNSLSRERWHWGMPDRKPYPSDVYDKNGPSQPRLWCRCEKTRLSATTTCCRRS